MAIRRVLRLVVTAFCFMVAYFVAIMVAPLACIILAVAWLIDKVSPMDDEKPASRVSLVWIYLVVWAYLAIELVFIPFVYLSRRVLGKSMPHPLDWGQK